MLGAVAIVSLAVVALVPFETAAFGGLTTPIVLTSGVLDDFNPGVLAVAVVAMAFGLLLSM